MTMTMSPTDDTDLTDWHSFSYYINGLNEIERNSRLRDLRCDAPGTMSLD